MENKNSKIRGVFPGLEDGELYREIEKYSVFTGYEAGDVLVQQGHDIVYIPFVLEGNIKIILEDKTDRELLLYQIESGDTCIMSVSSLLASEKSKIAAIVDGPTSVLLIPGDLVFGWMEIYPSWTNFVLKLFNKRLKETLALVEAIAFQNTDTRLWTHLCKKAKLTPDGEVRITHQELALELGTVREVISRLLKSLEKEKKVVMARGKVKILDFKDCTGPSF